MRPTLVIGHINPDTDSICSAICYADLKRRLTGEAYIPCRAGEVNNETAFVLEKFGIDPPLFVSSLEPRISDVQLHSVEGITSELSLRRAWEHMKDHDIESIPVVTKSGKIEGILTLDDEARYCLENHDPRALSRAATPYANIAWTLWGDIIAGDKDARFTKGKIVAEAYHPNALEENVTDGDLVFTGSDPEIHRLLIERGAGCIVICAGATVTDAVRQIADESGCVVIVSPMSMYTCSKLVTLAMPVSQIMRKEGIVTFHTDDLVSEVKATVSKLRMSCFPILDANNAYIGMMSQRDLLDVERNKVILIDHNEKGQAVDGIRTAEVVEVIDHHRIDSVETNNPIFFRAQPLGCTATIISLMFREHHISVEPTIAGLLCSAILSDTLMFRSPTCTPVDESTARSLAEIAGIDINEHAMAMFNAGSQLGNKNPDEIFHLDCKSFRAASASFMVSQITSVSADELSLLGQKMVPYMEKQLLSSGVDMLFIMLTNIIEESTELLFVGKGAKDAVQAAFACEPTDRSVTLPGVVSRKKQIIAPLMSAIENM